MPPRLVTDQMLDLFPQRRSPGKHVSSAIHRIMQTLHPDRFGDDPIDMARANLGNAVEKALIHAFSAAYPGYFVVPGELWHDDHLGTPDLWYLGRESKTDRSPVVQAFGRERAVVEVKTTWASSRRAEDIEDAWFWRYWQQARAYCHMSGFNRALLIIIFIVGDWKGNSTPVGLMWEDTWTSEELEETWDMIKAYTLPEEGQHRPRRGTKGEGSHGSRASRSRTRRGTR